eukprot:CAMPEP_0203866660 /NCGR_PEP_ID=MMETSP0359-20131031/16077_1 /ASSEMBLY_ACC=CAM_ASM_000338 /TAXON_ID=268821 /ORGANISM="Scrippsiella Hangoei, Strain SHTV-5" /LENGTH=1134 /DNA_ID=CAMNT_0050784791 /DNA_START=37 /DNA_END=3441 /DNA_ORIENTATION=-
MAPAPAPALLAVLSLAALCGLACGELQADGKVHDLTTGTFEAEVKRHSLVFVEFYAPWCGHCKKLTPEWDELAKLSKDVGIPIAKVDAIAEKQIAQSQGVESFPTFKLFAGDPKVAKKYQGQRTASKMLAWLKVWRDAKLLHTLSPSLEQVKSWGSKKHFSLVGFLTGEPSKDNAMERMLGDASFMLNAQNPGEDVPVGIVSGVEPWDLGLEEVKQERKLPCVVVLRNFELEVPVLLYPESGSAGSTAALEAFVDWVRRRRVPALIPAQRDTEEFFLQNIDPGHGLIIFFGEMGPFQKDFHEIAVRNPAAKLKWVHASADEFGESLGKNVAVTQADFPEVVLWEFGETEDQDKVFRLSQQPTGNSLSKANVEQFLQLWSTHELSADKDPVLAVTSDTFEEVVLKSDKDVLVEFYAPWCGQCKSLAPEYKQLALHYAKDKGVGIFKMDSTQHKHESVEVKSYPTLKLFPKGKKDSPIDPGFKTGRTKDSLIEFIEENRQTPTMGGTGSKKAQTSPAQAKAPSQGSAAAAATAPSSAFAPTSSGQGNWIFDDLAEPSTRGTPLSEDMIYSRSGFVLVEAGALGLLLSPGREKAVAVRRFDSVADAQAYFQGAGVGSGGSHLGQLPCPADVHQPACQAWCAAVWTAPPDSLRAKVEGKVCSPLRERKPMANKPLSCKCYDGLNAFPHAMCMSPCSKPFAETVPASKAAPSPDAGTCPAGDASCSAGGLSASSETSPRRYFLYDTKLGEGFNLQREVYPRAGWIVSQLNDKLFERCGPKVDGDCARWTLVLPPWCRVAHWRSGPAPLPWSTFFDVEALRGSKVPVIEFDEYKKAVGDAKVDLAITYATDPLENGLLSKDASGKFLGWVEDLEQCASKYRKVPEHSKSSSGDLQLAYSGDCEGGILAKRYRCASLDGPWPEGVVDLIASLRSEQSVLVKGYDYLLAPDNDALDILGLRDSMFFSQEIRSSADSFITGALGSQPYLAAHCRRTDFLRVREKTTPSAEVVAQKLNALLEKHKLTQVFVATDALQDLQDDLRRRVNGAVFFFEEANGAASFDHPGKQVAAEIWIASRADFFIGTIESRVTMAIQLERGFLGKKKKTSEQEFCKEFEEGKTKDCLAPKYRHPGLGAHRAAYFA